MERKTLFVAMLATGALGLGTACAYAQSPSTVAAGMQDAAARQAATSDQQPAADSKTTAGKAGKDKKLATTLKGITVVGYARSVETAIDYQRYSDTIKNVVTSESIHGLPDQSIADAMSRLPGVTAERTAGQASQMDIRGLPGNFIQTTMDGRVLPTTSGTNLTQFDDFPSELINRVDVYKSSEASLIEGGVGGSVDMHTANPLDAPKEQNFNVNVRGSYNSRANHVAGANPRAFRASAAYLGKFLDNTLGVGFGFAEMTQPDVQESFTVGNYSTTPTTVNGQKVLINSGLKLMQVGGHERRQGYLGTVVWRPDDHFQLKADSFFTKYKLGQVQRGILSQLYTSGSAILTNPVTTANGALLGGNVSSLPGGAFGIPGLQTFSNAALESDQSTNAQLFSGGLNARWHYGRTWITADLSVGHAQSHQVGSFVTADPFDGLNTASPRIADQSASFMLHGLGVGSFTVANPGMYTDLSRMAMDEDGIFPTAFHDNRKAFRTNIKYEFPDSTWLSSLEGGIYLSNHHYNAARSVWIYGSEWGMYFLSTPNQPPLTLDSSNATVACWKGNFSALPCFLSINPDAVLKAHGITPNPTTSWAQNWTMTQSGNVYVKDRDAYAQANIDSMVGNMPLTGNVGLRVVHTSQYSDGLQQVGNGAGVPIADGLGVISKDYIPVNIGQTYTKYLPSLNLTLHLNEGNQLRFSAAKVMSRPPIDQLKSGSASFVQNGTYNLSAGTNPLLNPLVADQYDLAFNHYWDDSSGVFVADVFFKSIKSFVESISIANFDFAGAGYTVPINPATGKPYLNGTFQTAYNAKGGDLRGIELEFAKTRFLPGIWSGLGVSLNYAYTHNGTKVVNHLGGFPILQSLPGLSKNVASAAVFYDSGKVSTRLAATYRSPFMTAASNVINKQANMFDSQTILDYQFSYKFTPHVAGLFQVLNLTNEPTRSYFGTRDQLAALIYSGRTLYVGLNANF